MRGTTDRNQHRVGLPCEIGKLIVFGGSLCAREREIVRSIPRESMEKVNNAFTWHRHRQSPIISYSILGAYDRALKTPENVPKIHRGLLFHTYEDKCLLRNSRFLPEYIFIQRMRDIYSTISEWYLYRRFHSIIGTLLWLAALITAMSCPITRVLLAKTIKIWYITIYSILSCLY